MKDILIFEGSGLDVGSLFSSYTSVIDRWKKLGYREIESEFSLVENGAEYTILMSKSLTKKLAYDTWSQIN